MEGIECIVCFSQYDEKEHRPRVMICGHTLCSLCLERAIREDGKKCPKCRKLYSASHVEELPVNFSLECVVKSLKISKSTKEVKPMECTKHKLPVKPNNSENAKVEKLPECPEHQLAVSHRCSAHKSWICQSCLIEDHSSGSCKIIPISEELNNKKSRQLVLAEPYLNRFEESCKKAKGYKEQYKKLIEGYGEDINIHERLIERLQEEIQRLKNSRMKIEGKLDIFDKKLGYLENKSSYDQAVISLRSSTTIRDVSKCSVNVQNEAEKLKALSHNIENETDLVVTHIFIWNHFDIGYQFFAISIEVGSSFHRGKHYD
ncbi:unnamed protein product, partial [Meganyctiphanes norvegica]